MARKSFKITEESGNEVELVVKTPEYEDLDEANKVYAYKIASLVRQSGKKKLLARSELNDFLRTNGIWTDADDKKVAELNKEIDALLSKLRKGGVKLSEGRKIAVAVTDKRKELIGLMAKHRVFDDSTMESVAETERNDYIVYSCTVYPDSGEHYWESFEDMKNDKISDAYNKALSACTEIIYGVDNEFETRLPENRWLKKYGFIDDELRYVDRKTKEPVDKDGRPVKELEEQVKKEVDNLQGEIVEEAPFLDDETAQPITL